MASRRLAKLTAISEKVKQNHLLKRIADSNTVKRIAQSSVVRKTARVFRAARYPSRDELWMIIRICLIGILIVGGVAFLVKFVFANGFLPMIGLSPI